MSEQTAPTEGTEETNEQGATFEPIASQEALDKIVQARIARERKRFEDYDDLKAKADKYAEWENAQKTEAQKTQEALEAAQRELAETKLQVARAEVAAEKGIPANLLSGSTREELETSADALIAFRGEQEPPRLVVPSEGKSPDLALNGDGLESALKRAIGVE